MCRVLTVRDLCKAYDGAPVVEAVSFSVPEGGILCVMGPSGAGKTTLLRLVMGLEQPDSGRITLPGDGRLSAVFQEDRLLDGRGAEENLRFVLGRAYDPSRAAEVLEALGLARTEQPVRTYSGGMRRRLALARALLYPSDGLILDEPFTGLDADSRARALTALKRWQARRPTLLVTHAPADARALGAQVLELPLHGAAEETGP